jgi:HECT-domain (ubiquitin-transferase)
MFNQQEVQIVIGGVNSPIDVDDLQRNTNYGGAFDEKHETIIAFWKVYPVLVLNLLRFDCPFPLGCQLFRPGAKKSVVAICYEL